MSGGGGQGQPSPLPPGTSPRKQPTMTTTEKITVTMSERAPLKIDPEVWPLIASAYWFSGQHECQANYIRRIEVREHEDGRRLVYGFHTAGPGGVHVGWRGASGGFLIEWPVPVSQRDPQVCECFTAQTIRAIRRVAGIIGDDTMADDTIADLPAEELT